MKNLVFLLLVLSTTSSYATLLIEPYLGHPLSTNATSTNLSGETTDYDIESRNFIIGSRVALSMYGAFVGVDYKTFTIEGNEGDDLTTDVYQKGRTAFVAGYNFPILLRAWISIAPESEFEASVQSNGEVTDLVYNNDEDITIGVGYSGLPFLSVNFELSKIHSNYFKIKEGEERQDIDYDWTIYSVSLSLPIDL